MSLFEKTIKVILGKDLDFQVGFIVCGTQKGGTSALDHYLRLHPEICMANKKEVHFFDKDTHFNRDEPDYSRYHVHFDPKEFHTIIGEATPIYMYWDQAMERIHSYNPDVKLIAVLRNPVKRAFSHWNMERDRNRESRAFWDAILEEQTQFNNPDREQHRTFSYLERGLYVKQIKQIHAYFHKSQFLLIQNESLRNDPNTILAEVAEFLSIPPFEPVEHTDVHSRIYTSELRQEELNFLNSFYPDEIQGLEDLLGWDLTDWKA